MGMMLRLVRGLQRTRSKLVALPMLQRPAQLAS